MLTHSIIFRMLTKQHAKLKPTMQSFKQLYAESKGTKAWASGFSGMEWWNGME